MMKVTCLFVGKRRMPGKMAFMQCLLYHVAPHQLVRGVGLVERMKGGGIADKRSGRRRETKAEMRGKSGRRRETGAERRGGGITAGRSGCLIWSS